MTPSSVEEKYYRHGPNLALFRRMVEMREYWDSQWMQSSIQKSLESSRSGKLGEFEGIFIPYLPKSGVILEAGCGTGRYVSALRARGYQVEGIDYAPDTIKTIHQVDPSLDVRLGDICTIDRPDGYYSGYISIGVLEHAFKGPLPGLREAYRVLGQGGRAIITVPQLNLPRKQIYEAAAEAPAAITSEGLQFYQDHIDSRVFRSQLEQTGFRLTAAIPYELYGGFIRDSRAGRFLKSRGFFHWRVGRFVRKMCRAAPYWLRFRYSHMMAFICDRA